MENSSKSYFFRSFLIIFLSAAFFMVVKEVLPKKIFSDKAASSKNILIDSMLIDAFEAQKKSAKAEIGDSLPNQPISFFETNGITFPEEAFDDYHGYQYLIPFFEKLYQLETTKTGNVRIAYYGDSMTDGDMIVQDLRSKFQETYGGSGVGFVSITSESAQSRSSISHEFSGNWLVKDYLRTKKPISPFGVNGHVFFANDTANATWVKYKASKLKNISSLDNPTLFYGSSSNIKGRIRYIIGKDTLYKSLDSNSVLNTLTLSKNSLNSVKIRFEDAKSIPIYGFNFDNGTGVHIDNFSKRGNSGMPISKFNVALMNAFQEKLGYDLVVLHYGTNVLNYGSYNYNWYSKSMTNTVNRIKECFPGVSILVISTADKASKYDTEMKTDSAVVPLTVAQKRYALKTQSGFVNLYTLMGGDGSMAKWVDETPVLANKDYTHFNYHGAKKVAGLLYNQLNEGYEMYKTLRKNRKVTKPVVKTTDSIN